MKVTLKPKATTAAAPAVKTATKKAVQHTGPVIGRQNYDRKVQHVGSRIPTASLMKKALGLSIAALPKTGYLLVHGDKPGILISEVKWDGTDVYQRTDRKQGALFGSLAALNSTKNPGFKAEIIDRPELLKRLTKFNRVVQCQRVSDESIHTVALLNSQADPYCAAVEVQGKNLIPMVLEPVAAYNAKPEQYKSFKDVKTPIGAFLPKH